MERERPFIAAAILALALAVPGAAPAQTPEVPARPGPPGSDTVPPEKHEPDRPIGPPPGADNLSEHLNQTDGVIRPPKGVDPGLVEPPPVPPAATPMPVIPPPGTPENQPNVQPQ
jgi:hypothetical protein